MTFIIGNVKGSPWYRKKWYFFGNLNPYKGIKESRILER
jgi:hypothetical protein